MGKYDELNEYLARFYAKSVFDHACKAGRPFVMYLHGHRVEKILVLKNLKYDLKAKFADGTEQVLSKLEVKMVCEEAEASRTAALLDVDKKVEKLSLEAIRVPSSRNHVKNKTLYPLMQERQVLFCTLLEGEVVRGLITGFTRYEITFAMKGGVEVTVLRHAVKDLRDKKGKSYLKTAVEKPVAGAAPIAKTVPARTAPDRGDGGRPRGEKPARFGTAGRRPAPPAGGGRGASAKAPA